MKKLLLLLLLLPLIGWTQNTAVYRRETVNQQFGAAKGTGTIIQLIDSAGNHSTMRLYELTHAVTATDSMATVFRNSWYKAPAGGGGGGTYTAGWGLSLSGSEFKVDTGANKVMTAYDFSSWKYSATPEGSIYNFETTLRGINLAQNDAFDASPSIDGYLKWESSNDQWRIDPFDTALFTHVGIGTVSNFMYQLVVGATSTSNNAFNIVHTSTNKNRTTVAQSRDTSAVSVWYSSTGSPTFQVRSKTGDTLLRVDSANIYANVAQGVANNLLCYNSATGKVSYTYNIRTMAGGGYDSTQMVMTGYLPMVLGVSDGFTVDTIYLVGVGASVDVDVKLWHGASLASGTAIDNTAFTCNSVTTGVKFSSGFESATIPAGSFIWATITEATTKCRRIAIIIKGHRQ